MYILYTWLLAFALLIFYIPYYFFHYRVRRRQKLYLKDRLGLNLKSLSPPDSQRPVLWFHAVSVGESLSLQGLIRALRKKHPEYELNLSCLTSSGMEVASSKLKQVDRLFFIPFDFGFIHKKYFDYLHPDLLVLVESEYWPNLLRAARRRGCPILVINARMTEKVFRRYRRLKFLTSRLLNQVDKFLVPSEKEKQRLRLLGVGEDKIMISGNMKCDLELPSVTEEERQQLRRKFGFERLIFSRPVQVFMAGSIHQGEEEKILRAFSLVRKEKRPYLLVIAPRHLDWVEEIVRLAHQYGFKCQRRTRLVENDLDERTKAQKVASLPDWDVLVLDTIGELATWYALADVVLIGGSLIPWGGHNLLEPAFYGRPIYFGPYMHNFQELSDKFRHSGGAQMVQDEKELARILVQTTEEEFRQKGKKAQLTLRELQGATAIIISEIEKLIDKNG